MNRSISDDTLLTADEVAARLRFSSQYIRKLAARGELPSIQLAGHHRFLPCDIDEYLKRHRRKRAEVKA